MKSGTCSKAMSQGLKGKKINEREKEYICKKKVAYSLSNPGWLLIVSNETDFVSGEELLLYSN